MTVLTPVRPGLSRRIPWNRAYIPFFLTVALFIVQTAQHGGVISSFQVLGVANNALPLALVGIGQTLVILTNGIDLSVGSVVGLANVIVAVTSQGGGLPGVLAALAAGCLAGLLNGLLVSYGRMAPLIVTLATGSIFGGSALFVLATPGGSVPAWLSNVTVANISLLPVALIWLAVLLVGGWLLLRRTSFGIYLQCLGSSEASSWSNGVPTRRVTLLAYSGAGLFAALAGVTLSGLTSSGDPNSGSVYLLSSIAVVVVGGTELFGGVGTLSGTVLGAVVLSLVSSVLFASGLSTNLQYVVTGAIVIGALVAHSLKFGRNATFLQIRQWIRRNEGERAA
jgi:ribose transport system permease protein